MSARRWAAESIDFSLTQTMTSANSLITTLGAELFPSIHTFFMWGRHHCSASETQCLSAFECFSKTRKTGRLFALWANNAKGAGVVLRPSHLDDLVHTPKIDGREFLANELFILHGLLLMLRLPTMSSISSRPNFPFRLGREFMRAANHKSMRG